ncbi:MAG: peptidoglycan-binding protein [Alphaproteobacteria bacterium]|nr:peptidoglycan-binding protein [Alphaproteobacteria bacterium]MBV8406896.1 peptidoglycan-binding protein [Alphaproteobacteria bacterium]
MAVAAPTAAPGELISSSTTPSSSFASVPAATESMAQETIPAGNVHDRPEPDDSTVKPATNAPAGNAILSSGETREAQAWLISLGFDPGPLDGLPGPRTTAAVRQYQAARQREQTGLLDRALLQEIRREMGH